MNIIRGKIEEKLRAAFSPTYIDIQDESAHHNHSSMNIESHFKVFVVSEKFNNHNLLTRHRAIYNVLKQELSGDVHALSITSYTPQEWAVEKMRTSSK
ncbi:BolA family protein [Candidatus Erwinia haradaeae]|uniref:DNA-binding transcriptional regulator BolA n=1 Tax=Candidatus Erwinia haradaeae TaxID=1922217 RepID=A0A451D9Y7_9GAMM|nr:BolA/IbaG family iron-sulfur metabolism protein [Candidatus Erwinia haradaeae]VFP83119.1 DNA-binding transcriptional regulator BolA [Candidatus Erwinia haradaeae]